MDDGVEIYDEPPQGKADIPVEIEAAPSTEGSPSSTPPAGWYNDPLGEGLRYWNGVVWSEVGLQSQLEFEALSQLSTLVNGDRDEPGNEHQQGETARPGTLPIPPPPPGWWQASDDKWYPPEQHPEFVASHGTATPVQPPLAPSTHAPEAPAEATTGERVASEWSRHADRVLPLRPDRPFYKDPWFWVAIAAVIVCPKRRRSHD